MLVLSRKIGEVVTVGTSVRITILSFDRGVVRLGIEAPKSIPIHRKEVFDKIIDMNRQAAKTELNALKNAISKTDVKFNDDTIDSQQMPELGFSLNGTNEPVIEKSK